MGQLSIIGNFLQENWFLVPNWKWIGLGLTIFSGLLILNLAAKIIEKLKTQMIQGDRISGFIKHVLEEPVHRPLSWVIAISFWSFAFEALEFHGGLTKFVRVLLHLFVLFFSIRLCYLAVDAAGKTLQTYINKSATQIDDQLTRFATQTLKVVIILLGILITLQNLGMDVGSVLAGLGIGGLALALAAQETVANFFGSVMIILDKPFKRGDQVKVGDTEGLIEEVGFRSTRIRTFYNSLVTIPNATMAKEKIDNMGERRTRRIRHLIGIEYETPIEKIQTFTDQIQQMLIRVNEIDKTNISVNMTAMGDFDLKILVNFYCTVAGPQAELDLQEEVLLQIMKIAKDLGVEFAYPTQTVIQKNH